MDPAALRDAVTRGSADWVAVCCILCLALLPGCRRDSAGPVHFAREEISVRVRLADPKDRGDSGAVGTIEVLGRYYFTCSAEDTVAAIISYPFPLDSFHGYPDSVALSGYRFQLVDSAARFVMRFPPGEEVSFTAWYRQPLYGPEARYIVTTTRHWRRPLDRAEFAVTVPAELPDARLNYQPDSTRQTDSTLTWFFTRRKFYPAEDVIVTWSDRAR